VGKLIKEAY